MRRAGSGFRAVFVTAALLLSNAVSASASRSYDLWIRNGTVIDGTGRPGFAADVLVNGDTIEYVGKVDSARTVARHTIDASGKIVAPGFIDAHSHGDPLEQSFLSFLAQGVTTVVLGQDGVTAGFDRRARSRPLAQWMQLVDQHGIEVNVATLSGHGALRILAGVGDSPQPTPAQIQAMQTQLRSDLAAGAFGLSFGLEYEPGRYAPPSEEKALGDLVGRYGDVVMSHMRSEDADKIGNAIDELLAIDAHVHISHIKIVAGHNPSEARAVLTQLSLARTNGREVTADVYPYLASASDLVFLYPDWAKRQSDYEQAVLHRRPELEAHIRKRVEARNGPEAILLTGGPYAGRTVAEVAKQLGKPYEKVMIDDLGYGGPAQAHFLMSASVQDEFITADDICISTDGSPESDHPRSAGSFVKILEEYVGAPPKMTLERAIYKMSGLAAHIVGLADRGVLDRGRKADILVFRSGAPHNRATWLEPQLQPVGFDVIVVNGSVAFENGRPDERRHGKVLKKINSEKTVPTSALPP